MRSMQTVELKRTIAVLSKFSEIIQANCKDNLQLEPTEWISERKMNFGI